MAQQRYELTVNKALHGHRVEVTNFGKPYQGLFMTPAQLKRELDMWKEDVARWNADWEAAIATDTHH
jgi:hypothetical protein